MKYTVRTNYFHVNDEKELYYLTARTCDVKHNPVRVLHRADANGGKIFCIIAENGILGMFNEDFNSIQEKSLLNAPDRFYEGLQSCLPDDEIVIFIDLTVGDTESHDNADGDAHILTKFDHKIISLTNCVIKSAKELYSKDPYWVANFWNI